MNPADESIADRKIRQRRELASLPPAVAQQAIAFGIREPLRDVTEPDLGLGAGLTPDDDDDALVDE